MIIKKRNYLLMLTIFCLGLFLIACSDGNSGGSPEESKDNEVNESPENDSKEDPKDPVTVSILIHWGEEMFNERFKEPIEEEFDHITLEHIKGGSGREDLEELFANGVYPDLIFKGSPDVLEELEIEYDIDELAEKHDYSFDHVNPVFLDSIRAQDEEGRLLGLPYEVIHRVLVYNKDIFDLFGQDYPTDDMTWDEALALAKKVTGEVGGINYRGLDIDHFMVPLEQRAINLTDPTTGEVMLDQDDVMKYMELIDNVISADESNNDENFFSDRGGNLFEGEQTTAMQVVFAQAIDWWKDTPGLNFDVAAVPYWEDIPQTNHRVDSLIPLRIMPYSEVKDAAFEVITHFIETDYQTWASRNGLGPVSSESEVLDEYFQGIEGTQDKNVTAVFEHPHAMPPEPISKWDRFVDLNIREYAQEDIDRNEWLRIVQEQAEINIENYKDQ